ncbi:MAG: sigma-70 family RNA polymerase sigma factor [Pseudomonadota bacterium]
MSTTPRKSRTLCAPDGPLADDDLSWFSRLYDEYRHVLVKRLRARFGSGPPEPEDMAQLAFSQLLRRGDWASINNPQAFLYRAASNATISELRASEVRGHHAAREQHPEAKGSDLGTERVLAHRELLKTVAAAIEQLPDKQRRIFEMNRFEGLTLSEIARREGLSRTSIRKHLSRAVATIDAFLPDFDS